MTDTAIVQRTIPEPMIAGFDEIKNLTHDECIRLWAALTGKAIAILRQRAQIILHFEREGWDIHALANGHAYYYQRIAYGQMLPELFIAVADPALLDRASRLPIPDQERVARNETVSAFLNFKENGEPYFQEMELAHLPPKIAAVVFHGNRICDKREQLAYARSRSPLTKEPREAKLVVDKRNDRATTTVGNNSVFFNWENVEAVYNEMKARRGK